jgi:hypothetical protein
MDRLPLEIIVHIASYLPAPPRKYPTDTTTASDDRLVRPRIASVSRKWQFAVEPFVFRDIRVKSTELDEFASVFSAAQSRRRSLLKELTADIILPMYSAADCAVWESNQDRLVNDKVASEAVASLFSILSGWGSDPAIAIALSIALYSPKDHEPHFNPDDPLVPRYAYSYIRLSNADKLPVVSCLKYIFWSAGERVFHPSSIVALAAAAPALEQVWHVEEPSVFLALTRQLRDDFIQSLEAFRLTPATHEWELSIGSHSYDHCQRLPNLVFPYQHDPLCFAVHQTIGNHLERLYYEGPVDPSLFWPYAEGEGPREPFWPSLADLCVRLNPGTASGRWYFRAAPGCRYNVPASDEPLPADTVEHMPPGYGSAEEAEEALAYRESMLLAGARDDDDHWNDDRYEFRVVPDDEVMLPLLEAFARAIAQMPAVKKAHLSAHARFPHREWFVSYVAPGIPRPYDDELVVLGVREPAASQPRVFFHVQDWRPSKHVLDLFRKVGTERHGQDAAIAFLPTLWKERPAGEVVA